MKQYFPFIDKIPFEGTESKNPMAFHYYEPERLVMGKKFEEGQMTFEEAYEHGKAVGEPRQTSGKQELYEAIVAMY